MDWIALKLKVTTCDLVKTRQKYLLIDTGYDYEWSLFCEKRKAAQVNLSDISHLILTHHHDDHAGLLNNVGAIRPFRS